VGATITHKLGVRIPIEPPEHTRDLKRWPSHAKPGMTVQLGAQPIGEHPEHADLRRWKCVRVSATGSPGGRPDDAPCCAGQSYASEAELIAAHQPVKSIKARAEAHVFACIVEVPEQTDDKGTEIAPGRVYVLTPSDDDTEGLAP
jgi:hypothetical protein